LLDIFNYTRWRNFENTIEKAKKACEKAGEKLSDRFAEIGKTITSRTGASKIIDDIALTSYACYLVPDNSDPAKPEIAFAQTYSSYFS
jgi:DNA-damage-inducible protein D